MSTLKKTVGPGETLATEHAPSGAVLLEYHSSDGGMFLLRDSKSHELIVRISPTVFGSLRRGGIEQLSAEAIRAALNARAEALREGLILGEARKLREIRKLLGFDVALIQAFQAFTDRLDNLEAFERDTGHRFDEIKDAEECARSPI